MGKFRQKQQRQQSEEDRMFDDDLVKLFRCSTVVKGGRRFSFGALVVVGDRRGRVGFGYGKANEVPPAVEKGNKLARRSLFNVPLEGTTIPHRVMGRFGASKIALIPASEGTGVIAGATARSVLELAGVQDVLTKCYGSTSPKNLVKAVINGLKSLRSRETVAKLRGVTIEPSVLKKSAPAKTVAEPDADASAEPQPPGDDTAAAAQPQAD